MKRIMKTCGSIAIAAAMMFSVVGVIPAKAAETTITPDEFNTMAKQVAIATEAIAKNSPTKTEVTVNVKDLPLVGTSVSTVTESIDPINHTAKRVSVSSGVETETYTDIAKGCSYTFNKENDRYEVNKAVASTSAVSKLAEFDVSKFAGAVITVDDVKNGVATKVVNIKSALEGEALKAALAEIKGAAGGAVSALPVSSLGGFDLSSSLNKLSLDISLYIDDTYVLHSIAVSGTIGLDFSGVPLEIGIDATSNSEVTTDSVEIPADFVSKAQLVAGFSVSKSGAKFKSKLSGKNTVFSVTGVSKTSVKKLTIPASISQFGKSYKVTAAAKNAFSKAKKLTTLVVKNAALKKALKKSPKKYGLSKKVKIK